jgi:lipid A 4'-phosphatase
MGYVLVLGTCLIPRFRSARLRGLVLAGALVYGSLLGATRIIQGGHFLSDVLWSGSLMCFLVATLQAVLSAPASPNTAVSHNPPRVFNAM